MDMPDVHRDRSYVKRTLDSHQVDLLQHPNGLCMVFLRQDHSVLQLKEPVCFEYKQSAHFSGKKRKTGINLRDTDILAVVRGNDVDIPINVGISGLIIELNEELVSKDPKEIAEFAFLSDGYLAIMKCVQVNNKRLPPVELDEPQKISMD